MSIEAMKQALEALEHDNPLGRNATIIKLRQAIDEAEKEAILQEISDIGQEAHTDHPARHWDRTCPACVAEDQDADEWYEKLLWGEKQEPVACLVDGELYFANEIDWEELNGIPLYSSPARKEWVGLDVNDCRRIRHETERDEREAVIELTETILREKNT